MRRVVITGLGLVTPIGIGVDATWQALLAGKSGAGPITNFDATGYASQFACEVKDWAAAAPTWFDKRELKHYDRFLQFGVAAAMMAMDDAGFADRKVPAGEEDRWGCYIGAGLGGVETIENTHDTGRSKGPRYGFSPYFVTDIIINMVPGKKVTYNYYRPAQVMVLVYCETPFGKSERIVLNAGLMGGKTEKLSQGYQLGDRYVSDANLAPTTAVYALGYYVGVSFNLS